MKQFVSATRKWGELPVVLTVYSQGESENIIENKMYLDDFSKAMIEEIGSVKFVFTDDEFKKRFLEAKDKIVKAMAESVSAYGKNIPADI